MKAATRFLSALFVWLAFSVPAPAEIVAAHRTGTGVGFLEVTDGGLRVLHLEGSYYDMGRQHAALLADETHMALRSARAMISREFWFLPPGAVIGFVHFTVYKKQEPFIPAEFKDEMRGLADESGVDLKTIEALHALTFLTSCSGAAAWGEATQDGELYFMRSNDIAAAIDPKTDRAYHDAGMVVVYKPEGGMPYLTISWPGMVGASDGMNGAGIAIGNMSLPSRHETPAGLPMLFRIKQALAKSGTLDEAVRWMTERPLEGGYNFLVADAKLPDARAIEMDARALYVGGWDGPAESNSYSFDGRDYSYYPLVGLLLRANHPLSSELIAHRERKMDDGEPRSKITYQRYRDLRERLEQAHGSLTLHKMMEIMRAHYNSIRWEEGPTLGLTSHQFVFAPRTGEMIVSISHGNPWKEGRKAVSAFNRPCHLLNFEQLVSARPPSGD